MMIGFWLWLLKSQGRKRFLPLWLDLIGALSAFVLSYLTSTRYLSVGAQISDYIPILLVFIPFLVICMYLLNGYKPMEDRRSETELEIIVKGTTLAFFLLFATILILFKGRTFSRYVILSWWSGSLAIISLLRFSLREVYKALWRRGYLRQRVLVIGSEDNVALFKKHLSIQKYDRFDYIEGIDAIRLERDEFERMLKEHKVDRVFIIPYGFYYETVSRISDYCRGGGVSVAIVSDEFSITNQRINLDEFTGLFVLEASENPSLRREWNKLLKRGMDLAISLVGLPVLGLLYIVIGMANKMEDGGPVIYRRRVMGKGGKEFDAFKFRSMLVNADEILELDPELKREYERNFKLENDPRLTRVGKFIRRYSIDELPQLVNVLLGQMSLVGPRMKVREEIEKYYGDLKDKLLSVKPGITGFWQVHGRQRTNYDERIRMDMFYIDHWSIWMDIIILIKTVWKVLKREGAY